MIRRRLIRAWQELRFRDALLLTFLPLLALGFILSASVREYLRARVYDDWYARGVSVRGQFSSRVRMIAKLPASLRLRDSFSPDDNDAGVIRFEVPGARWDSLEVVGDAPWAPWLDGTLRYGGTSLPIRLRKRGDNSVHWLTEKRSLSVRTPRDDFYKRFRSFALSGKDVLPSYVANRMAQSFGLLAPTTEVTPVYLNNRFYGVYRFIEVVDESFLRPLNRMPGNIFRGDAAERGEYQKGTARNLFANPRIWDRASANDRWTSAGSGQLRLLLEDIAGTTFADHQRMMGRLDRGEYANLFAYLLLMGDPYHIDGVHNQLLYEDPSTQKLTSIPWDTRLRDLSNAEQPLNDLFRAVLRDPYVVDSTMMEIAARVANDSVLHDVKRLIDATTARYGRYLAYDRQRTGIIPDVGDAESSIATMRGNIALLRRWLDNDSVASRATPTAAGIVLDLETRGHVGADLVSFVVSQPVSGATVRLDANANGVPDASDPLIPLRTESSASTTRLVPARPIALLPAWDTRTARILAGHVPYRLFLSGLGSGVTVTPELRNRATGRTIAPTTLADGAPVREGLAWHPWAFPMPTARTHRLSGTVRLATSMHIPAGDTLILAPGTTVSMAPEVSIVSEGRVIARGTSAQPIRLLPQQPGVPWGTFVLLGRGADSSVFANVEFAQGGGALINRIEYTGMVNVHHVQGVLFDSVTFRENLRSDDAMHALHANVRIQHSRFLRANSDALDLDIATGEIVDNLFENSGNDALDLMSSAPVISGNRMIGSGDKGISVGEASRPFVFNNFIDGCEIGIETKDRSDPIVLNNVITNSRTGLRERRKNWRYGGGGWPILAGTIFDNNATPWKRDDYSRVTLEGVSGLDTSATRAGTPMADLGWLYQLTGVVPPSTPVAGLMGQWTATQPAPLIDEQHFEDDFGAVADGWTAAGGVDRLEKRRDALVIGVERAAGTASRAVRWTLPSGGTLVLELSSRHVRAAKVTVTGRRGDVAQPIAATEDLATARFVVLTLPPGEYHRITIALEPVPGLTRIDETSGLSVPQDGRIDLRSYRLLPASSAPRSIPGVR